MRVRRMCSADMAGVISVYDARAAASVGLLRRSRKAWGRWRRMRWAKSIWTVAFDRGKIVGYAMGYLDGKTHHVGEVIWRPEYDGTLLGQSLLDDLLKRMRRLKPASISIWGTGDSLALQLRRPEVFSKFQHGGVFMAAVTDTTLLLRDARGILEGRVECRLKLRVGRRTVLVGGRGGPLVEVTTDAKTLLKLLLGIRGPDEERRRGKVKVSPGSIKTWRLVRRAFPSKRFSLEDGW